MKKNLLTVAALVGGLFANAQVIYPIQQGNFLGGGKGQISFSSQEQVGEKYKEVNVMIRPTIGYFVLNQVAAGINLDYKSTTIKLGSDEIGRSNELGAGFWARYYFLPATKKLNFFSEAGFNTGGIKVDDQDRIAYNSLNGGVSMAYFINSSIALELGIDYNSKKYEDEDERVSRIGVSAGFQLQFACNKKMKTVQKSVR